MYLKMQITTDKCFLKEIMDVDFELNDTLARINVSKSDFIPCSIIFSCHFVS